MHVMEPSVDVIQLLLVSNILVNLDLAVKIICTHRSTLTVETRTILLTLNQGWHFRSSLYAAEG
jgi:hypothetical protein